MTVVGELNDELTRKVMRAAREPSRVFASSDTRDAQRLPLAHVQCAGEDWYGPNTAAWLYRGDDCKVLQRAINSWGVEARTDAMYPSHLSTLLSADVSTVRIGELHLTEYGRFMVPIVTVEGASPPGITLASPVFYAIRRFGTDGVWLVTDRYPVIRYESGGKSVAVIRLVTPPAC